MKSFYFIIALFIGISITSFAQPDRGKMKKQRSKIHQLEKIKLIEALNLDENTSIKFFVRRNDMQNETELLQDKSDDIMNKIGNTIDSNDKNIESVQKQLITELLNVRQKMDDIRNQFIDSLSDLLPTDKIARYLVFEQKFREEIRKILFDRRHRPEE
jgi:gas vesicle protein